MSHIMDSSSNNNNTTLFDIAYRPYRGAEFIPPTLIDVLMCHHFRSAEVCHSFSDIHRVYKITVGDLLLGPLKNWEYNRPPDLARCPDIARYIYHSKAVIDTMIYLSYNNIKEVFDVIDGIHRLTALRIIVEENRQPANLLCPSEFGSNSDATWLYSQSILINIRFNASQGTLIESFKTLNKSQAVPDLYIKDQAKEKRDAIDVIANDWYVRYKSHFSSSAKPNLGNTNRNLFVELLDALYEKYRIADSSPTRLQQLLEDTNRRISENIPTKATADMRVKCKETGCYLFLHKNDKLATIIE